MSRNIPIYILYHDMEKLLLFYSNNIKVFIENMSRYILRDINLFILFLNFFFVSENIVIGLQFIYHAISFVSSDKNYYYPNTEFQLKNSVFLLQYIVIKM